MHDYAGENLRGALAELDQWTIEIVKHSDQAEGFVILPKRRIVERSFAWLGRCPRITKDVEAIISSSCAWLMIVHIMEVRGKSIKPPSDSGFKLSYHQKTYEWP